MVLSFETTIHILTKSMRHDIWFGKLNESEGITVSEIVL